MVKNPILLVFGAVHVLEEVAWKDPEKDKSLLENLSNVAPNSNESRIFRTAIYAGQKINSQLETDFICFLFCLGSLVELSQ